MRSLTPACWPRKDIKACLRAPASRCRSAEGKRGHRSVQYSKWIQALPRLGESRGGCLIYVDPRIGSSIKRLEPIYEFERKVLLTVANIALAKVQACLELGDLTGITDQNRAAVQGYNRDDCLSTWRL